MTGLITQRLQCSATREQWRLLRLTLGNKRANKSLVLLLDKSSSRAFACTSVSLTASSRRGSDYEKHLLDKQLAVKEDEAALDAEMEFAQGLRAGGCCVSIV